MDIDLPSLSGPIEPFLVFADALQEKGDVWGELIALDCAIETTHYAIPEYDRLRDSRAELLEKRGAEICFLHGLPGASVAYQRGFITAARFGDCAELPKEKIAEHLNELLWLPAAKMIQSISFEGCRLGDEKAAVLFDEHARLRALGGLNLRGNHFSTTVSDRLRHEFGNATVGNQDAVRLGLGSSSSSYVRDEHRAFIRAMGGPRSIDDYD